MMMCMCAGSPRLTWHSRWWGPHGTEGWARTVRTTWYSWCWCWEGESLLWLLTGKYGQMDGQTTQIAETAQKRKRLERGGAVQTKTQMEGGASKTQMEGGAILWGAVQTKTDGGRGNKDTDGRGAILWGAVQRQMEGGATKTQMEGGAILWGAVQTKTDGGRGNSLRGSANKDRWREGQFFEGQCKQRHRQRDCWSLLYSTILCFWADSLHLHVILHEWLYRRAILWGAVQTKT